MRYQITLAALAVACFATPASAQSDTSPGAACPAQYELIGGTLCMKAANGDIVLPTPAPTAVRYTNANCRSGYEILVENQCMNPRTGDIIFASEAGAMQTVQK